jgi:hypothetical protein
MRIRALLCRRAVTEQEPGLHQTRYWRHALAEAGGSTYGTTRGCALSQVELEELRDLYGAGNQLGKVLRKLAKVAEDDELQQPLEKGPTCSTMLRSLCNGAHGTRCRHAVFNPTD